MTCACWMLSLLLVAGQAAARGDLPNHAVMTLRSAAMQEERRIAVYTPPSGARCGRAPVPVLYMLDGGIAEDFPHMAQAVDELVRARAIRPLLLVGIENTERRRDMTGPTQDPADLEVTANPGGSARLRRFIRTELQPFVERTYDTGERAVVGESLAGLFVVETLLEDPALFDVHVALDPSAWWNREQLVKSAGARMASWPAGTRTRLLLASAGDGNAEVVDRLAGVLRAEAPASLQWSHLPRPDLRHDNIYRSLSRPLLRALFPMPEGAACDGPVR